MMKLDFLGWKLPDGSVVRMISRSMGKNVRPGEHEGDKVKCTLGVRKIVPQYHRHG